ncbi:SRPBCC family protein [Pseudonocardia sp. TRM90224]|uniref:SRPBCC family protein n=1 Tax=Pseudonocardia sp. TRM90224 TaxID=2812678 RepID=UPI001E323A36|nr:SRPBCC family protein [Pseudonocardia sp. TRM90224]
MEQATFVQHDGRPAVRFRRTFGHPVERVWAAITETEDLRHWFPSSVRMEQVVGGRIEFTDDPNIPAATSGTVLAFDPPRRLAYTWETDELIFELAPTDAGCVLTFVHVLGAENAAARTAAGWQVCLAELDKHVDGEPAEGPHSSSALPWQPVYDAYVAAGMPSGAPIPSAG